MPIAITELTNGSVVEESGKYIWQGDGVFDVLIAAVNKNLQIQVDESRLPKSDFALAYSNVMPSVLSESVKFILQRNISTKNEEVLTAQKELYERQKEGLDDDKHQKVLNSALGAWGVTYQDAGESLNIPNHLISSTSGAHIGLEKLFDNAMSNRRDATVEEPATVG